MPPGVGVGVGLVTPGVVVGSAGLINRVVFGEIDFLTVLHQIASELGLVAVSTLEG